MEDLTKQEIPGIVISEDESEHTDFPKNRGRYRVYIPTYMNHHGIKSVIWCKNHIHKYRYGINEQFDGDKVIFGEYKPLQIGARVIVKFFSNNISSGYIDRTITDYEDNCLPFALEHMDQNDVTVLLRTAKHHNLVAVLEDIETEDVPKNSFHIYYDDNKVRIIMNEDGMYTWVEKDKFTRILQNNTVWIHEDNKHFIDGNNRYLIEGNNSICIKEKNKIIVHGLDEEIYKDNRNQQVEKDKNSKIFGTENKEIQEDHNEKIDNDHNIEIGNDRNEEIENDNNIEIGNNYNLTIGKESNTNVGENSNLTIGKESTTNVGENSNLNIGKEFNTNVGENSNLTIGKEANIEAGTHVNIKAPVIRLNCS
ncbi:MAG: bacteriophage T4 gp5 trimerization domain-containing protein [bacterium]